MKQMKQYMRSWALETTRSIDQDIRRQATRVGRTGREIKNPYRDILLETETVHWYPTNEQGAAVVTPPRVDERTKEGITLENAAAL